VRYAPDAVHTAMIDPPADVSVLGADVVAAALGDCGTGEEADGVADGEVEADAETPAGSCPEASCADVGDIWARALLTWSTVSVRTGVALMPWPIHETATTVPLVATTAPASHAETLIRMRPFTPMKLLPHPLTPGKGNAKNPDRLRDPSGFRLSSALMAQLLLVEDDAAIRRALIRSLTALGHAVASAATAMEAVGHVVEHRPDLVLLDLGLPDLDGREALRLIRTVSAVPVIVATARDDEAEMIRVLDNGADDYIVKPFGAGQLDARIRAVLRRTAAATPADATITVGRLTLRPDAYEARLDGTMLDLSPKEFDLLHYLASRPGQVVTKRDLLSNVWRQPYGGADKTVDVHLAWLRRKLGESAQEPRYLRTVRGVGIKLVDPTQ
jgi:two-component system, OmpR family, KDP operon response regulator KdpE